VSRAGQRALTGGCERGDVAHRAPARERAGRGWEADEL
jgi:hypothetical protein